MDGLRPEVSRTSEPQARRLAGEALRLGRVGQAVVSAVRRRARLRRARPRASAGAAAATASRASSVTRWISAMPPRSVSSLAIIAASRSSSTRTPTAALPPASSAAMPLAVPVGQPQALVVEMAEDAAADHPGEQGRRCDHGEDQPDAGAGLAASMTQLVLLDRPFSSTTSTPTGRDTTSFSFSQAISDFTATSAACLVREDPKDHPVFGHSRSSDVDRIEGVLPASAVTSALGGVGLPLPGLAGRPAFESPVAPGFGCRVRRPLNRGARCPAGGTGDRAASTVPSPEAGISPGGCGAVVRTCHELLDRAPAPPRSARSTAGARRDRTAVPRAGPA